MYILKFVKKNRGYEKITFKEFEFSISCIGRVSLALTTRYDTLSALRLGNATQYCLLYTVHMRQPSVVPI